MNTLTLVNIEFAAATHLMMSLVLFFFARRSVQFLSQAWIMLLICLLYCGALSFFACGGVVPSLGILHPVMLIYLMICSFLLSVYPLGLCMPGYLQWGRMWGYAIPALCVIFIYGMGAAVGSNLAKVYELDDFLQYFLSGDILLRLIALLLSGYYIVNIFRLPHRLVRSMQLPSDLIAYGSALGAVSIFFVVIAVKFSLVLLNIYVFLFTLVNLFLFFRILRPSVEGMAYPAIHEVEKMPTQEEITQSEIDDFNEANLKRFKMMEYIMLHEKPFIDTMFNRERLCRLVGFNRHVVLQSLRSQGYNDIHEYISRHRVAELRRLIESGEVTELKETDKVGFKTSKTAIVCFERYEGTDLNALLEEHAAARSEEPTEQKAEDGATGE
ncbi:MAG: hypothetical protein ACI3YC_03795 [Alloprevotella sp.]